MISDSSTDGTRDDHMDRLGFVIRFKLFEVAGSNQLVTEAALYKVNLVFKCNAALKCR